MKAIERQKLKGVVLSETDLEKAREAKIQLRETEVQAEQEARKESGTIKNLLMNAKV